MPGRQDLERGKTWPPQVTEITEGGGLFHMLCALCVDCGLNPVLGERQELATEVTEITEGGGLFFMLCALCALCGLNPVLGVPHI